MLYFFITEIVQPLRKEHKTEKESLELKNEHLLSLFTTLNPNPVFRFDTTGTIVLTNTAGHEIVGTGVIGTRIQELIPEIAGLELGTLINTRQDYIMDCIINGRDFSITVKGVPELLCGHIYCYDITERKKYELDLENTKSKLRDLALHISDLREEDRTRLGMELHDNISQTLTVVKMIAERFSRLNFADDESFTNHLYMKSLVENLIIETKELSYSFKPKYLSDLGLAAAVYGLVKQATINEKIKGQFFHFGLETKIPPKVEVYIFRIIQELVNNILRHSGANSFIVQIFNSADFINILVQDDGNGFDRNRLKETAGLGLVNIKERVDAFNGSFDYETGTKKGTEFIIQLPHRTKYEPPD